MSIIQRDQQRRQETIRGMIRHHTPEALAEIMDNRQHNLSLMQQAALPSELVKKQRRLLETARLAFAIKCAGPATATR